MEKTPLLRLYSLKKHFPVNNNLFNKGKLLKAVDGVDLHIYPGETLGLVGESGSGKSTIGRMIVGLTEPTDGKIIFDGIELTGKGKRKGMEKDLQMIFQDPYASLNPRMTVGDIMLEPLNIHKIGTKKEKSVKVDELLERVGLGTQYRTRYPIELSGGQRQRLAIARALVLNPKLIVCDEPVSALDVSIQAQILNLLKEIQKDMNLAYLFIAHGIQAVKHISDRVAVMYLGNIMEISDKEELFANPHHPYTKALLSAVPVISDSNTKKKERIILKGDLPSPVNPPTGCPFHTRCPVAMDKCKTTIPELTDVTSNSSVSCLLYE